MLYLEAVSDLPESFGLSMPVFLAGGITNCPDWQAELVSLLADEKGLTLLNPRRKDFPIGNPDAASEQIRWEYAALQRAHVVVFWFARGSINPIVLFEYGKELGRNEGPRSRELVVGCDLEYERTQDVRIQSELANPHYQLSSTLEQIANRVISELRDWKLGGLGEA